MCYNDSLYTNLYNNAEAIAHMLSCRSFGLTYICGKCNCMCHWVCQLSLAVDINKKPFMNIYV